MFWERSHRGELRSRLVADRHYNRQKVGAAQFVPPGRCLVLFGGDDSGAALWVTSWPFAEYVRHAWAGAWVCSAFRNEGSARSSALITDALSATRYEFGDPPELGMITFVDRKKVKPTIRRGEKTWGFCYLKAGFEVAGETKGGLLALRLRPELFPAAAPARGTPGSLLGLL